MEEQLEKLIERKFSKREIRESIEKMYKEIFRKSEADKEAEEFLEEADRMLEDKHFEELEREEKFWKLVEKIQNDNFAFVEFDEECNLTRIDIYNQNEELIKTYFIDINDLQF